jgi:hypothetical protein
MLYDLFICHASEDKDSFVRPLADALRIENVEVWYDEFSLKLGDSIRRSLDKGLLQSRFGVVVLSKSFFAKQWPQYELDGLAEREMRGQDKIILPIWHGIKHRDVLEFSPSLANRHAVSSDSGLEKVIKAIIDVVRPQQSPLIAARDILLEWGTNPPVITDEYWLHIVEASNRTPASGGAIPEESIWGRWSFPLPQKEGGPQNWGERLAWTAMQLDWVKSADEIPITPLSEPDIVLEFIDDHPGLYEICEMFPTLLVEYAPQLTIPGMGGEFERIFEELYRKSIRKHAKMRSESSSHGSGLTINKKCPMCDEEWALRHPTFGDYEAVYVTNEYFSGGMFGPPVSPYEHTDHAFWLLSKASSWMPENIREFLIEGMANWSVWLWWEHGFYKGGVWKTIGSLANSLIYASEGKNFKWNTDIQDDVIHRIEMAIATLQLPETSQKILDRFLKYDFPGKYLQSNKRRKSQKLKKRNE